MTIEYLNLNFVTTPNLTPLHSFFAEKVFISCVWLIPVSLVPTLDRVARPIFFDTDIWQHILSDLKLSARSATVDIFNQLKRKNVLSEEMQREGLKLWELVHSST